METDYSPAQFDWRGVRPEMREHDPLSGQVVSFRSHNGTGCGFRGIEYKPDPDGIVRNVPIEAIQQIESMTYWTNGKPSMLKFDIVQE